MPGILPRQSLHCVAQYPLGFCNLTTLCTPQIPPSISARLSQHHLAIDKEPPYGVLPAKHMSAPSARALKTSLPRRIPPSIPIIDGFQATVFALMFRAAAAQAGRASSVAGVLSSWRRRDWR